MENWFSIGINLAEFILTVLVITWRVSNMLAHHNFEAAENLSQHEKEDQKAFNNLQLAVANSSDELRKELASITTAIQASIMAIKADLSEKINRVELETSRQYLPKDAFYAAVTDIKDQSRADFNEVKNALLRLERKIDEK